METKVQLESTEDFIACIELHYNEKGTKEMPIYASLGTLPDGWHPHLNFAHLSFEQHQKRLLQLPNLISNANKG